MNTKANIIIIEDEKNICNFIETVLSPPGLPGYQRQYRNRRPQAHRVP